MLACHRRRRTTSLQCISIIWGRQQQQQATITLLHGTCSSCNCMQMAIEVLALMYQSRPLTGAKKKKKEEEMQASVFNVPPHSVAWMPQILVSPSFPFLSSSELFKWIHIWMVICWGEIVSYLLSTTISTTSTTTSYPWQQAGGLYPLPLPPLRRVVCYLI